MIYPNQIAANFCYWMLNFSSQKLTGPQKLLVQQVQAAALAGGPVTTTQWYNFQNFTAWRFPFFEIFLNCQSIQLSPSPSVLISSWLQAIAAASLPPPSLDYINKLYNAVNASGISQYAADFEFIVLLNSTAIEHCTVPFINNAGKTPVINGTILQSGSLGSYSDGSSYLDTGFKPSTDCTVTSLNDFVAFVGISLQSQSGNDAFGAYSTGASSGLQFVPWNGSNKSLFRINSNTLFNPDCYGGQCCMSAGSNGGSYNEINFDGLNVQNDNSAHTALLPLNLYALCFNYDGTANNFYTSPVQHVGICNNNVPKSVLSIFSSILFQ